MNIIGQVTNNIPSISNTSTSESSSIQEAVTIIQKTIRGQIARKDFKKTKEAATTIQKATREQIACKDFKKTK